MRLRVEVGGHSIDLDIPPYPFADWRKVALTQVVFQKDYPMVWIRDQALFYHRAHGYERMVVYDNGSSNIAELKDCLARLDEGLQVLLIRWPFPMFRRYMQQYFGRRHETCTQLAAYNHHLHLVAPRSTYVSQFDLDEYLLNRSGQPLADYLASRDIDMHRLWTERVANVTASRGDTVRAVNFKWQSREKNKRYEWNFFYKFIYRVKPLIAMNPLVLVHRILLSNPKLNMKAPFSSRRLMYRILHKLRMVSGILSLAERLARRTKPKFILFHYDGIRTNWGDRIGVGGHGDRRKRLPLNSEQHQELIDEMPKLLARIGLADKDD